MSFLCNGRERDRNTCLRLLIFNRWKLIFLRKRREVGRVTGDFTFLCPWRRAVTHDQSLIYVLHVSLTDEKSFIHFNYSFSRRYKTKSFPVTFFCFKWFLSLLPTATTIYYAPLLAVWHWNLFSSSLFFCERIFFYFFISPNRGEQEKFFFRK